MNEENALSKSTVINIVLVTEAVFLLAATAWSYFGDIKLADSLMSPNVVHILIGTAAGVALSAFTSTLFWLGRFDRFSWLAGLRDTVVKHLAPMFNGITFGEIILLSLASGFCEEIFFRGVLQHQIGLLPASIVFGAVHCPSIKFPHYGIWACLAGLLLGWLYLFTQDLWTPIAAHVVNNIIGLTITRSLAQVAPNTEA